MSENISRSWFCVFNNPEKYGYEGEPEEIVEKLKHEWIDNNPSRKGYWAYCISDKGLKHVHMILEHTGAMRMSLVKSTYPKAHLEATKGNKKQIISYIRKEPPYDEKGEQVIVFTSHGNIEGNKQFQLTTNNDVLRKIEELLDEGLNPNQIMEQDIKFRKEETLIRKAYFAKRYKETPPLRDIKVIWHLGNSGEGKSYSYIKLCEKYGEDKVYFFTDYSNKGIGGFDGYMGESILFMDELKPGALPFELLLTLMQGYRNQLHCRFNNSYSLWSELHITSIYSPEQIYEGTVRKDRQKTDNIKQLLRRITQYVYHYKENNQFKEFVLEGDEYTNYSSLKKKLREDDKIE